jgi:predicted small secreted protein
MRTLALMLLAISFTVLTGCNTVRGFGKDLETVGNAITRKAN